MTAVTQWYGPEIDPLYIASCERRRHLAAEKSMHPIRSPFLLVETHTDIVIQGLDNLLADIDSDVQRKNCSAKATYRFLHMGLDTNFRENPLIPRYFPKGSKSLQSANCRCNMRGTMFFQRRRREQFFTGPRRKVFEKVQAIAGHCYCRVRVSLKHRRFENAGTQVLINVCQPAARKVKAFDECRCHNVRKISPLLPSTPLAGSSDPNGATKRQAGECRAHPCSPIGCREFAPADRLISTHTNGRTQREDCVLVVPLAKPILHTFPHYFGGIVA